MQLQLCTWPEVEAYLERSRGIIMPIGSTEQHGPNGLIGTDAICAEVIARRVGEEAGALVGPTIGVGMAEHHMAFPGSMTLRPSTLILVIRDYVLSLAEHGFRRFFFLNGHGGNLATVRAAFYEVHAELRAQGRDPEGEVRCQVMSWWEDASVAALSKEFYSGREGSHATPSEVSVTRYAYPEHIKNVVPEPETAPTGAFHGARDFRRRFPDGRIGSAPALAQAEHGRRLVEASAAAVAARYRQFESAD